MFFAKFTQGYEISKYTPEGSFDWSYTKEQESSSSSIDRILDVSFDEDHDIYVSGIFYEEDFGSGILITKFSNEGDFLWERSYDNSSDLSTWTWDTKSHDDQLYIVGNQNDTQDSWDALFLVYDSEGSLMYEHTYDAIPGTRDISREIFISEN